MSGESRSLFDQGLADPTVARPTQIFFSAPNSHNTRCPISSRSSRRVASYSRALPLLLVLCLSLHRARNHSLQWRLLLSSRADVDGEAVWTELERVVERHQK